MRKYKAAIVSQYGGYQTGSPIGGGRDHFAASGVFFVHCKSKQADPIQGFKAVFLLRRIVMMLLAAIL